MCGFECRLTRFCITNYSDKNLTKINEQIIAKEIRVIDSSGEMLGVMHPKDALRIALQKDLDLVEISPNASPPVCKIMNYGKYKYEVQKKAHEAKKKQKVVGLKELKLRPTIAGGDYGVKVRNAKRFIEDGDKVKISLMFKGREVTHEEVGFEVMERFKQDMQLFAKIEVQPKREGKQIYMIVSPISIK